MYIVRKEYCAVLKGDVSSNLDENYVHVVHTKVSVWLSN
jgi:hypothetical protein